MIPVTFHDGNPEDRRYVDDLWSWLREQPQDVWLLWARRANWDNADRIFGAMVADPACDLALVSWLFWHAGPADFAVHPDRHRPGALLATIVENVERGFYRSAELACDRYEVAMSAQQLAIALRSGARPPFALPRALCGPFRGRPAAAPVYDEATERGLEELFRYLDGGLPRSEAEHHDQQVRGGNLWLRDQLTLPVVPVDPLTAWRDLDDAAYLAAIFGPVADYETALGRQRRGLEPRRWWWPFRS